MKPPLAILATLLLHAALGLQAQGPYCGAVGTAGCTAIKADSSAIVGWATGCVVTRGPVDIAYPDGPKVRFGHDTMALGPASTDTRRAVSLGDGGSALITFAAPITNGEGYDFAVFENSFNNTFLELAFVEVSTDGRRFVRFPATSLTPTDVQVGPIGNLDPTNLNNLAGKYRLGYGTPFDLEELRDSAGINIDSIVYVRLIDVIGTIDPQYASRDAEGRIVNDPYPTNDTVWASGGFDLTGVAVLHQLRLGADSPRAEAATLWPNPARGSVQLTMTTGGSHRVEVYDMRGLRLLAVQCHGYTFNLDISALSQGLYMLLIDGRPAKLAVAR